MLLPLIMTAPTAPVRCPTDIVFMVDESTSVTHITFTNQVIPFLKNMTNELNINEKGDHVSLVHFSSPSETGVAFYLDSSFDRTNITNAIDNLEYTGGTTATKKSLTLVRENVFVLEHGARRAQYKKTIAPVILIITDGVATDGDVALPAEELRLDDVDIFAVGVGRLVSPEYLQQIAGDMAHVFPVKSFKDLNAKLINDILATTQCEQRKQRS